MMKNDDFFSTSLQIRTARNEFTEQRPKKLLNMAIRRYKSKNKSRSRSVKKVSKGSVISFFNVGTGRKERGPVDGIITRSNKRGRSIRLAHSRNRYNEKLYRIISNVPASRSRSHKRKTYRRRR